MVMASPAVGLTSVPESSAAELDDSIGWPKLHGDLVGTYSSTLTVNDDFEDGARTHHHCSCDPKLSPHC